MDSEGATTCTRRKKPRARRFPLSSFPQYVSKVQSKMKELRQQAALTPIDRTRRSPREASYGPETQRLVAKSVDLQTNGSSSKKRRNLLSSCFDPQSWSPVEAQKFKKDARSARVPPLPRILAPLTSSCDCLGSSPSRDICCNVDISLSNHSVKNSRTGKSRRPFITDGEGDNTCKGGQLRTREYSPRPNARWTSVNATRTRRDPAPPSQSVAALPAEPKSPLLTIPSSHGRPSPGTSIHSLVVSTAGSSTTSSNISTPIPSSPSPLSFLVASKSSLSSNEPSPPLKPRNTSHSLLPLLSNSSHHRLSASSLRMEKTSSLPQFHSRTQASKTPTRSLGRSPARSPVCSYYLMPITKLHPIVRPQQAKNSTPNASADSRHLCKDNVVPNQRGFRGGSCWHKICGESDLTNLNQLHVQLPQTVTKGDTNLDATCGLVEKQVYQSVVKPSNVSRVSIINDTERNCTNNTVPSGEVAGSIKRPRSSVLHIPTITIRSATPVKTPSEDNSLASLFEQHSP